MRQGGQKAKGSQFERVICVALSKWISNGEREDIYWRSSISGGRTTAAKKRGKLLTNQAGDISAIDPIGHRFTNIFVIECKHLKDIGFESAIKGNGELPKIWAKLTGEAVDVQKSNFLVMRQNNWPVLLGLQRQGTSFFDPHIKPLIVFPKLNLHVYLFDDWLNCVDPTSFK